MNAPATFEIFISTKSNKINNMKMLRFFAIDEIYFKMQIELLLTANCFCFIQNKIPLNRVECIKATKTKNQLKMCSFFFRFVARMKHITTVKCIFQQIHATSLH